MRLHSHPTHVRQPGEQPQPEGPAVSIPCRPGIVIGLVTPIDVNRLFLTDRAIGDAFTCSSWCAPVVWARWWRCH